MKIIKIFGIVAGIHFFALILIFANPGCSSTAKQAPAEMAENPSSSSSQPPLLSPTSDSLALTPVVTDGNINLNQNAANGSVRFSPTRPNSAASTALEAQPVSDVTPATTYTVVKGDSLWTIAKKNNTTIADIKSANNLKDSALRLGQKLVIPGKEVAQGTSKNAATVVGANTAEKATPVAVRPASSAATVHVVKPGETLGVIARQYHVKQGDVATANNISDPKKLRAGQELVIPGVKAAAVKTPAAAATATKAPGVATPASAVSSGPAIVNQPSPSAVPTIIISDTPQIGPSSGPASVLPANGPANEQPPIIKIEEAPQR